ncbi:MAG TPA: CofH family radical SAM protein [Candidatus Poseidoniales archaeon]|nr:MAG TPA: CofH family radical SAM protein [Candidatus Poseidoniales archaeon]
MRLTIFKPQVSLPNSRIGLDQATAIYTDMEFHELLNMAQERRRAMNPGNYVTYLVDRNINYTNACTINCQFCSFYRPPDHPEAYTQTVDEISERISELEEVDGTRILMQGGVNPDLPLEWYTELISELRLRHPDIAFDCFSPIEIEGIAKVANTTTAEVLRVLKEAGMTGLPGGGAEMLVDNVRLDVSPIKGSSDRWIEVMREAQRLDLTTSATNVFGFGETLRQRVEHLDRIRNLQDEAISEGRRGFTSFIAWPVQLENNSFGRRNRGRNRIEMGAGPIDYLRHLAISRLYLDNIPHIQASWPTMGLGIAQIGLSAGADDIGSTMMEENVVSASGTTRTSASELELRKMIELAGFRPVKRDSDYLHL